MFQSSALPGSVPSSASVAVPRKLIVWPVCHVVLAVGAVIVGTGSALPAVTVRCASFVSP